LSFVETVEKARRLLERNRRLSLRALKREFALDDDVLEELVEELVAVQGVAAREGGVLVWADAAGPGSDARAPAAPEPEGPAAERRQLTVLFCDLVDSTRLAAGMDAEDWRTLVSRYHAAAGEVVARFEGHVAQYLGDGLLAYFGWPKAHEDDAERAVRAGLGIVQAVGVLGSGLAVRVGIHTGPVVVGEIGGSARRETLAMGDTTNLAARLQGIAEPDTVVMSAASLRLVSGIFVTRDRGTHAVKGLAEPVRAVEAVQPSGVRSRLDVVAATELTPFIGREQELMLLEDRFAQVAEGRGQAVLIQGEAGIGKSRLLHAFRERIALRAHSWLECRGSAYTQDSAFYPLIELHRHGLGFRVDDPAETKLERIETGLVNAGFDPAQTVPIIAALHGVPLEGTRFIAPDLSPEGLRKKTFALATEWLLRLGRRQPLVLLMEDLHWMDPSSIEHLGMVLEQIPAASVLLLGTYRPDFAPPWGAKSFLTPMLLSRFTRAQLADLVRKAARGRDLPDTWVDEILRRADGVPLFAEELTRTLLDQSDELPSDGKLPLHIPETLQDSLMARLDALGPVKELAQLGSVLGREFSYDLLLAVSPQKEAELQDALRAAVREELFYQRGTPPDATYLFKHALIRDAAYQSMLRATRQRHHRRVAETLIERLPELAEAQPELVAQHWTEAGDAATAIAWWLRAGERAVERALCAEGEACARRGLALLDRLSDEDARREAELRLQMLLGLASIAKAPGHPQAMGAWQRARELSLSGSDLERAATIRHHLGLAHNGACDFAESLRVAAELKEIQERLRQPRFEASSHYVAAMPLWSLGRISESLAESEAACAVLDSSHQPVVGMSQPSISCWAFRIWAEWLLGYPDRSRRSSERSLELAQRFGLPYSRCYVTAWSAVGAALRRDWSETRRLGLEASQLGGEHGFELFASIGAATEAGAAVHGDGDLAGIDRYARAIQGAGASGNRSGATHFLGVFADLQLTLGRPDEALRTLEGALGLARATGEAYYLAELLRLKGEAVLGLAGHDEAEAEALFRESIETARGQEAKSWELRTATSLARLWQRQGRRREAHELLAPDYAWFTEGFDTLDLIDAKALLEELA